jgi:alpha-L-rhamnosidase
MRYDHPTSRHLITRLLPALELYINGQKIGDAILSPAMSEYGKRVYYITADVMKELRRGDNAVGVILGQYKFSSE